MGGMAWFLTEDTDDYLAAVSDFLTGFLPPHAAASTVLLIAAGRLPARHGPVSRQHSPTGEAGCGAETATARRPAAARRRYGAEAGCGAVNDWAAVMADGT
jgi:hypothetical protein